MEYLKKILFSNKKIKFNIFSFIPKSQKSFKKAVYSAQAGKGALIDH